jgi:hypothetical protein
MQNTGIALGGVFAGLLIALIVAVGRTARESSLVMPGIDHA